MVDDFMPQTAKMGRPKLAENVEFQKLRSVVDSKNVRLKKLADEYERQIANAKTEYENALAFAIVEAMNNGLSAHGVAIATRTTNADYRARLIEWANDKVQFMLEMRKQEDI